jgi:hypothetical protein
MQILQKQFETKKNLQSLAGFSPNTCNFPQVQNELHWVYWI